MMRILHISDLHFGSHNAELESNLEVRVRTLRPNLIVATGDLADQPDPRLLKQARQYLEKLSRHCRAAEKGAPILIAIPGNHDVKDWGLFGRTSAYKTEFTGVNTQFYYRNENIWIYGLDSCGKGGVGANGFVRPEDLVEFDQIYHQLQRQHSTHFEAAYKIVLIHHHPLPIQYDSKYQRWLTLDNGGEFLGEMLKHKIDLILHGHEHVQARCRYGRALRNIPNRQAHVVAVGATLRKGTTNWFQLITIEQGREVRLDIFGADGSLFDEHPESVSLLSFPEARAQVFERWIQDVGYCCQKVASITILGRDGDAHRIVECEDLTILNNNVDRAFKHEGSTVHNVWIY